MMVIINSQNIADNVRINDRCSIIYCKYLHHQGVEYYQCTYAGSPKAWCATGVDSSSNVITNRWVNKSMMCS